MEAGKLLAVCYKLQTSSTELPFFNYNCLTTKNKTL